MCDDRHTFPANMNLFYDSKGYAIVIFVSFLKKASRFLQQRALSSIMTSVTFVIVPYMVGSL